MWNLTCNLSQVLPGFNIHSKFTTVQKQNYKYTKQTKDFQRALLGKFLDGDAPFTKRFRS